MTVGELIAELKKYPEHMQVCVWDHDEDENMPVVQVLQEDGTTTVDLLTHPVAVITVHPFGSCGGECGACGDQPEPVGRFTRVGDRRYALESRKDGVDGFSHRERGVSE